MLTLGTSGQIYLTRGDSCIIPFEINQGTTLIPLTYELEGSDALYFGIMEPNQPFEQALVRKKFTAADMANGVVNIKLSPTDTLCLLPGKYYYQIKLAINDHGSQIVNTLIPKTEFWIED